MTFSITYVLLLTFFLHGGPIVTTGIVAHSQLDCEKSRPLIVQMERDTNQVAIDTHKYKIDYIDGQCIRVPAGNNI